MIIIKRLFRAFVLTILSLSLLLSAASCGSEQEDDLTDYIEESIDKVEPIEETLTVGYSQFDYFFNPLLASSENDKEVVRMTSLFLIDYDNNNQIIYENDSKCVANVSVDKSKTDDIVFSFKLRKDLKTSDGDALTADDAIFTLYVLSDVSYNGPYRFFNLPIIGIDDYRNNEADYIDGIKKIDDYSFEIHTYEFNEDIIHNLNIPIIPIKYYGDAGLYDYSNNSFGFKKGDVSSILNIKIPYGGGPYAFKSYTENKISFLKNQYYYKGAPNNSFVDFIVINNDTLGKTFLNDKIDIYISDPNVDIDNILQEVDISEFAYVSPILLNGYGYIGINANNVFIEEYGDTEDDKQDAITHAGERSKYLRRAFAVLFDAYKGKSLSDNFTAINVPTPIYYDVNIDNVKYNYTDSDVAEANLIANATQTAIDCFKNAGYTTDPSNGKFVSAPDGAKLNYEIALFGGGIGNHPCYSLLANVKNALASFGIGLDIIDYSDYDSYLQYINSNTCCMWVSAWDNISSQTLYQLFHSNNVEKNNGSMATNIYGITDGILDEILITDNFDMKAYYSNVYEYVFEWAVEVPIYQKQKFLLWNNARINEKTLSNSYSQFNSWIDDICKIEFKKI